MHLEVHDAIAAESQTLVVTTRCFAVFELRARSREQ